MTMADFIRSNLGKIADRWQAFAVELQPSAANLHPLALRDYAEEMFNQLADYMSGRDTDLAETARNHAANRLSCAFSLEQVASEFHSARTSIARSWTDQLKTAGPDELQEMVRFNAGLDQLVEASVAWYHNMLVETERRFRAVGTPEPAQAKALADHSPDAVLVDLGDRIIYANPTAARMLGAESPAVLIGRSPFDIVHPDYHGVVRERIARIYSGEVIPVSQLCWRRLDGNSIQVEVAAGPVPWNGDIARQVIARDISQRGSAQVLKPDAGQA